MQSRSFVQITLSARTEEVDGQWRAFQDELGLFAYGRTEGEAATRIAEAVEILVDSLNSAGGLRAISARFKDAGIEVQVKDAEADSEVIEVKREMRPMLPFMLTFAKTLPALS